MPVSRRSFLQALGLAGAGAATAPLVGAPAWGAPAWGSPAWGAALGGRGREALAAGDAPGAPLGDSLGAPAPRALQLDSNENPRGPAAAALAGARAMLGEGARYPDEPVRALREAVAAAHGVRAEQVLLGCGSTELLRVAVDAYAGPTRPVVTAAPTFETVARRAEMLRVPVAAVPVDRALRLDLDAMAARAAGAGVVYVCNPNNPTGTLHGAAAVRDFVARVRPAAPDALVVLDEAYHEYVEDPAYATAAPLAAAEPGVLVVRTFSKAYGLAGLRVGYAVGHPATVARLAPHVLPLSLNAVGIAAAHAALGDAGLAARERRLNREARDYAARAFARAGFAVVPSEANFLMVDVRRDPRAFQAACRARGVLVGRPFPPLATHARVSVGTLDEMRRAVPVCLEVLGGAT